MRKFGVLTATIFITILIAGVYGILHDQVTYTISQEYFTKFKYRQFGFKPAWCNGHRQTVAVIGFLATWWVGLWTGLIIGLTGLIYPDHHIMKKGVTNAIKIVFVTAVIFGLIGFFRGRYYLIDTGVNWWFPEDLIDKSSFIIVGSINNYSYLGGIIGLIIGIVYMLRDYSLVKRKQQSIKTNPSP
ncbi:MAG: hypothetical protein JNN00_17030 [Chitinophagaceae bacterium]|nr:hypothetical protein [Chitinophagaceae bacterium]